MNLFRYVLAIDDQESHEGSNPSAIRQRVLQIIYLTLIALNILIGIIMTLGLTSLADLGQNNKWLYIGLLVLAVLLTNLRKLPYSIRAYFVLLYFYITAIANFQQAGLGGTGPLLLLAFSVLGFLLFANPMGISHTIIGVGTLLFYSFRVQNFFHWMIPAEILKFSSGEWLIVSIFYLVLSLIVGLALSYYINNLNKNMSIQRRLTLQVEKERNILEIKIEQRTHTLERRLAQITAVSDISRSITSILDLQEVLQRAVDSLVERTKLYYSGIFLIDDSGRLAILKAGSGEAGKSMVANKHQLEVGGNSMIGWTTASRMARIALDVGAEAVRFNNPYLPETRSELAIPILSKGNILGALTIQSNRPNAFDEDDVRVFQGIADSLAAAVDNTRLFSQIQRDLEEIRSLNQHYLQQAWSETAELYGSLAYTYDNPRTDRSRENGQLVEIPLILRDQEIGRIVLEVGSEGISIVDKNLVEAIASQTAIALESARLLEESQHKAFKEEKINQISASFSSSVNIDEILRVVVKELGTLPSVSEVAIHLIPPSEPLPISSDQPFERKNGNHESRM
jgi:GAF domain-containing protein